MDGGHIRVLQGKMYACLYFPRTLVQPMQGLSALMELVEPELSRKLYARPCMKFACREEEYSFSIIVNAKICFCTLNNTLGRLGPLTLPAT